MPDLSLETLIPLILSFGLGLFFIGFIAIMLTAFIRSQKHYRAALEGFLPIPEVLAYDGHPVPIRATFGGFKGTGPLAFGRNNLNPRLILHDSKLQYRVAFGMQQKSFSDIEEIGISGLYGHVRFFFKGGTTLSVFIPESEVKRGLLIFCKERGLTLSEKATEFTQ